MNPTLRAPRGSGEIDPALISVSVEGVRHGAGVQTTETSYHALDFVLLSCTTVRSCLDRFDIINISYDRLTFKVMPGRPSAALSWKDVRPTTAASKIVALVKDAVFSGQLRPGDRLGTEPELARQFGVSRLTVRDALRSLAALGMVRIRVGAGGGAWIAEGNPDAYADALAIQLKLVGVTEPEITEAQVAVEAMAAGLAARKRTSDDLERLVHVLDRAATLAHDAKRFTESSFEFHLAVAEASHNRALVAQLKALRYVIWPEHEPKIAKAQTERVLAAHRELYGLLQAGDEAGARRSMCAHLQGIRGRLHAAAPDGSPTHEANNSSVLVGCWGTAGRSATDAVSTFGETG